MIFRWFEELRANKKQVNKSMKETGRSESHSLLIVSGYRSREKVTSALIELGLVSPSFGRPISTILKSMIGRPILAQPTNGKGRAPWASKDGWWKKRKRIKTGKIGCSINRELRIHSLNDILQIHPNFVIGFHAKKVKVAKKIIMHG